MNRRVATTTVRYWLDGYGGYGSYIYLRVERGWRICGYVTTEKEHS